MKSPWKSVRGSIAVSDCVGRGAVGQPIEVARSFFTFDDDFIALRSILWNYWHCRGA